MSVVKLYCLVLLIGFQLSAFSNSGDSKSVSSDLNSVERAQAIITYRQGLLRFSKVDPRKFQITVHDLVGKDIVKFDTGSTVNYLVILNPGMYFVRLQDAKNSQIQKLMVYEP